ncbi:MAG: hypothetical protein J0H59_04745 [Comamonadaceae bacterium]|nr:hypothetical protein [Comamonadaceae bacterium]
MTVVAAADVSASVRRILFRCDGGQRQGWGHLSRCISLARHLRTVAPRTQITFWGHYDAFACQLLTQYGLPTLSTPLPSMDSNGVAATRAACFDFDVLLLDSYVFEQHYVDGLKQQTFRLALMDDEQRHDLTGVDLVICFRVGAEKLNYGARHQLLGPSYFPVKPELISLREHNLTLPVNRPLERLTVFLSGGDIGAKYLPTVLQALAPANLQIAYLAPHVLDSSTSAQAQHFALTPAIESIYAQSDLVICGGGLTKYECAYACIPNACLSLTALQDQDTKIVAAQGFTLDLGLAEKMAPSRLCRQITEFIHDPRARMAQCKAFASKLNANGPYHVARTLLAL